MRSRRRGAILALEAVPLRARLMMLEHATRLRRREETLPEPFVLDLLGEDDLLDPSSDLLVCGPCLRDASEGLRIRAA